MTSNFQPARSEAWHSGNNAEIFDLRRHATTAPGRTAIVCGAARMSCGELEALANRLAAVWRGCGVRRGDHVATLLRNRPEALAVVWAAWRCGVYLTPMSTALTAGELRYLVEDCDARVVLADAALHEQAAPLPTIVKTAPRWLSLAAAAAAPGAGAGDEPAPAAIDGFTPIEPLLAAASPAPAADEVPGALMLYTSGTTGAPKGVGGLCFLKCLGATSARRPLPAT